MRIARIGVGLLLSVAIAILAGGYVSAADCKDVRILLARGSGQPVGLADESAIHTCKMQLARQLDDVKYHTPYMS